MNNTSFYATKIFTFTDVKDDKYTNETCYDNGYGKIFILVSGFTPPLNVKSGDSGQLFFLLKHLNK